MLMKFAALGSPPKRIVVVPSLLGLAVTLLTETALSGYS
jgi:hypothetical protein